MKDNLFQDTGNVAEQFGFNPWLFLSQLFALVMVVAAVGLPIWATIYCLRHHRSDSRLPLWLLLTWLVPIAGPICTLCALRRVSPPELTQDKAPTNVA